MKAEIIHGTLTVTAENNTEAYALRQWDAGFLISADEGCVSCIAVRTDIGSLADTPKQRYNWHDWHSSAAESLDRSETLDYEPTENG